MKQEYITPTTQTIQSLIDTSLMQEEGEGWALAGSNTHGEAGSGPGPAPAHSM